MRRILITFLLAGLFAFSSMAEEMVLKGTFQGKNLFVKNPFSPSGVGFCIYEVTVNGLTSTDEINSSAFEVDLSVFGFQVGEALAVAIKYKTGCEPMVLNPEVLYPLATFEITSLFAENNKLKWQAKGESGSLPFIVEQFKWNKWVKVGEIDGKGTPGENEYSTKVRFNSGENKFRVKQVDYKKKPRLSSELKITSEIPEVTFMPKRVDNVINFSAPTMYEVYDEFGGIVFKGYGETVNVEGIQKGKYYLNFDNQMSDFIKK